jgi:hypothetical protein
MAVRGSVHELRNALNGLVVNLEVVRSRLARAGSDDGLLSFAEQATDQAEESVALNEGVGGLLSLIMASVDASGRLRCARSAPPASGIRFDVDISTAERVLPGLRRLGQSAGFSVEIDEAAVILTFPQTSSEEFKEPE